MGKKCTCGIFKLTFDYSLIYLENNHSCILSAAQIILVHGPLLVGGRVGGGGVAGVMRPILGYNALLPHSSHRAACQVITFHLWSVVTWRQLEADPPPGTTMASALLVTLLGLGPGLLALQLSPDLSLDWSLEEVEK